MLLRPQRAGWGGWAPAFGSFGGERQNSGVIAARLLEDLGVKNSTQCHVYLCSFSLALWIGVMLMADSLNRRQGFLLGGNIIFLSVDILDLCRVLKLRLFSRFGGSSPHHHNDHGTNCGFYPFLFIVFHFEVWQKKIRWLFDRYIGKHTQTLPDIHIQIPFYSIVWSVRGFKRQWAQNGGRCGVCGDPWDLPQVTIFFVT